MGTSKNKCVYIVHGYMASPTDHWFPWLKNKLEQDGVSVNVLAMPNANDPDPEAWYQYLQQNIVSPDEDTYFVGHSLGSISLLNYLAGLKNAQAIGGLVVVAGFAEALPIIPELNDFTQQTPDMSKIIGLTASRAVIVSDNDDIVPPALTHDLARVLKVEPIVIEQGGHFMSSEGFDTLPAVYDVLNRFF